MAIHKANIAAAYQAGIATPFGTESLDLGSAVKNGLDAYGKALDNVKKRDEIAKLERAEEDRKKKLNTQNQWAIDNNVATATTVAQERNDLAIIKATDFATKAERRDAIREQRDQVRRVRRNTKDGVTTVEDLDDNEYGVDWNNLTEDGKSKFTSAVSGFPAEKAKLREAAKVKLATLQKMKGFSMENPEHVRAVNTLEAVIQGDAIEMGDFDEVNSEFNYAVNLPSEDEDGVVESVDLIGNSVDNIGSDLTPTYNQSGVERDVLGLGVVIDSHSIPKGTFENKKGVFTDYIKDPEAKEVWLKDVIGDAEQIQKYKDMFEKDKAIIDANEDGILSDEEKVDYLERLEPDALWEMELAILNGQYAPYMVEQTVAQNAYETTELAQATSRANINNKNAQTAKILKINGADNGNYTQADLNLVTGYAAFGKIGGDVITPDHLSILEAMPEVNSIQKGDDDKWYVYYNTTSNSGATKENNFVLPDNPEVALQKINSIFPANSAAYNYLVQQQSGETTFTDDAAGDLDRILGGDTNTNTTTSTTSSTDVPLTTAQINNRIENQNRDIINKRNNNNNYSFSVDTNQGASIDKVSDDLLTIIDEVSSNNTPLTITSGYRNSSKNKEVGGAVNSKHLKGDAVDVRIKGMSPSQIASVTSDFKSKGLNVINEGDHLHVGLGKS